MDIADIATLPSLSFADISVVSATKVEFRLKMDEPIEEGKHIQYSQLRLLYSDDPAMLERVQKKKLDAVSFQKSAEKVFFVDGLSTGTTYYFSILVGHQDIFNSGSKPSEMLVGKLICL